MPIFENDGLEVAYAHRGAGPPVLLIHGFPQTHRLWDPVAHLMAPQYELIMPDLRGYGASAKPDPSADPALYSFREMAQDLVALMRSLGHDRFHIVGHDRGARVAYRLVRDVPDVARSLTLMDIVPTDLLVETCDFAMATAYFHWTFLAQPAPFAERMIEADPDHFFEACLLGWGGAKLSDFPALESYRAAWRDPACIAAMTADYRAAVSIDVAHDRADEGVVRCPSLVLYGRDGVVGTHYDVEAVWRPRLPDLTVSAMPGGHFFVDQHPDRTARALLEFLGPRSS